MRTSRFQVHCYINKNTPELRDFLLNLGYTTRSDGKGHNIVCENGVFETGRILKESEKPIYINCNGNSRFFMAISSMRSDCDYMQQFVAHKLLIFNTSNTEGEYKKAFPGDLFTCKTDDIRRMNIFSIRLPGEDKLLWHKASINELIYMLL